MIGKQYEGHKYAKVLARETNLPSLFDDKWITWLWKQKCGEKYFNSLKPVAEEVIYKPLRTFIEDPKVRAALKIQFSRAIAYQVRRKGINRLTGEEKWEKTAKLYGLKTWYGPKKNVAVDTFTVTLDTLDQSNQNNPYILMMATLWMTKDNDIEIGIGEGPEYGSLSWSNLVNPTKKKKKRNTDAGNGEQPDEEDDDEDNDDDEYELEPIKVIDELDEDLATERQNSLPPNLQSGFGGTDASEPVFSPEAFRANLFNFEEGPYRSFEFINSFSDVKTYDLPHYLSPIFTTVSDWFTITGESKRSFTHNLSNTVDLGASFAGFGAEFSRTFKDNTNSETFEKYMARYDREYVYAVGFNDTDPEAVRDHLTDEALEAFETWSPEKIIKHFGTHYMERAYFGGLRIISSTLDTRDVISEKVLERAIDLKASKGTASISADASDSDNLVVKISSKMQTLKGRTIGGTAVDRDEDSDEWRKSLLSNPATVNYVLKPIEDLIDETYTWEPPSEPNIITTNDDKEPKTKPKPLIKRDEVRRLAQLRLHKAQPVDNYSVLAVRVPLKAYFSDYGTHATNSDITVAYPEAPKGWLRIAQFISPRSMQQAFQDKCESIVVRANPNRSIDDKPAPSSVVPATGVKMKWNLSRDGRSFGFFKALYNENGVESTDYKPIGDIFEPATDPAYVKSKTLACFHKDVIVDLIPGSTDKSNTSQSAGKIWDDKHTGAATDCVVVTLPMGHGTKGNVTDEPLVTPQNAGYTFESHPWADLTKPNDLHGKTLDWSKVKFLDSNWLN